MELSKGGGGGVGLGHFANLRGAWQERGGGGGVFEREGRLDIPIHTMEIFQKITKRT